jgi:hypothetical protein
MEMQPCLDADQRTTSNTPTATIDTHLDEKRGASTDDTVPLGVTAATEPLAMVVYGPYTTSRTARSTSRLQSGNQLRGRLASKCGCWSGTVKAGAASRLHSAASEVNPVDVSSTPPTEMHWVKSMPNQAGEDANCAYEPVRNTTWAVRVPTTW